MTHAEAVTRFGGSGRAPRGALSAIRCRAEILATLGSPPVYREQSDPRDAYWWGHLMDENIAHGLIRDIEVLRGKQSTHEAECALRYEHIEQGHGQVLEILTTVQTDLKKLTDRGQAAAWSANWKAWSIATSLFMLILGALAWTGGQLYALEPLRAQAAHTKP